MKMCEVKEVGLDENIKKTLNNFLVLLQVMIYFILFSSVMICNYYHLSTLIGLVDDYSHHVANCLTFGKLIG